MGFFDFLKKSKETSVDLEILAPITGRALPIEEVPDPTFAGKLLGDGMGIEPNAKGEVVSPVEGKLIQLFKTGHAFTVESKEGVNVLVHFGLDTVELNGEGFEKLATEGDEVKAGQPIIRYDYDLIKGKVPSVITPVVILDADELKSLEVVTKTGEVEAGKTVVLKVIK